MLFVKESKDKAPSDAFKTHVRRFILGSKVTTLPLKSMMMRSHSHVSCCFLHPTNFKACIHFVSSMWSSITRKLSVTGHICDETQIPEIYVTTRFYTLLYAG